MPRQTLLFDENRYCWLKPRLNQYEKSEKGGDLNREKSVVILYDNGDWRISLHHVGSYGFNAIVPDDFIHHYAVNHNLWILWHSSSDTRQSRARLPGAPIKETGNSKKESSFLHVL